MFDKKLISAALLASGVAIALSAAPVIANAAYHRSNDVTSLAVYGDALIAWDITTIRRTVPTPPTRAS